MSRSMRSQYGNDYNAKKSEFGLVHGYLKQNWWCLLLDGGYVYGILLNGDAVMGLGSASFDIAQNGFGQDGDIYFVCKKEFMDILGKLAIDSYGMDQLETETKKIIWDSNSSRYSPTDVSELGKALVHEIKGFQCDEDYSCNNLHLQIINKSPSNIKIEDLDCEGNTNAVFTLKEINGLIIFEDCIGATQSIPGTHIAAGKCFPFGTTSTPIIPTTPTIFIAPTPTIPQSVASTSSTNNQSYVQQAHAHAHAYASTHTKINNLNINNNNVNVPYAYPPNYQQLPHQLHHNHHQLQGVAPIQPSQQLQNLQGSLPMQTHIGYPPFYAPSPDFQEIPIIIEGDLYEGTEIDCNGDRSWEGAQFKGTNIKEIKCNGDISCSNSIIIVFCTNK